MDKSRLQKNLRSKLAQSSKAETEPPINSEKRAPAPVAKSKKAAPAVAQKKEKAKKSNPVRSELRKKIEKDVAEKKQAIFAEMNLTTETTETRHPEPRSKKEQARLHKKKVAKAAKTKQPLQPLRHYMPLLSWYSMAILIVLFDQMTKAFASSELIDASPMILTSWLQFDLVHNPGAAFSLFADAGGWQRPVLVFISLAVSIFLVLWLARLPTTIKLLPLALTFILGGAVGNLIDRAVSGFVVDFISVHYQLLFFPSFNIADAAISCGAVLLFLDMFVGQKEEQTQQAAPMANATPPMGFETDHEAYQPTQAMTAEELIRKADEKAASAR